LDRLQTEGTCARNRLHRMRKIVPKGELRILAIQLFGLTPFLPIAGQVISEQTIWRNTDMLIGFLL